MRDCTIYIQPIPGFRNSNSPLSKHWRIAFDSSTTALSYPIPIDKIINIIDDDDCGTTQCWIAYSHEGICSGTASISPTSMPSTGQRESFFGNVAMTGTSPNFVFNLRLNLEEGYGQYEYCIVCDGAKQTTRVTYPSIMVEQVRNCATSLVIKSTCTGSPCTWGNT